MSQEEQPRYFPSAQAAVSRAREDLLGFLRSTPDANLGVSAAQVERSQPGAAVPRVLIDFQKLLVADSTRQMEELAAGRQSTVVPLAADDTIVTVVEVGQDSSGWRVAGLGDRNIARDLGLVSRAAGPGEREMTLYEVPNLQARIYAVRRAGAEILFTDYRGKFSLQNGVSPTALIPVLKADAIEFQRTYGEELKKRRLVR